MGYHKSVSGQLTISTPSQTINSDYSFYINFVVSGGSWTITKITTISVFASCSDSNCLTCYFTNASLWTLCKSGYNLISSIWYNLDIVYKLDTQALSSQWCSSKTIEADLTNSISGSTPISYSISNYLTAAPSWILIASSSGKLTINAPLNSVGKEYDFYVVSSVSGDSGSTKKLIKLTITSFQLNPSNEANIMITIVQILLIVVVVVSAISASLESSTFASMWSLINQVQIFFLLLLTRAYIPDDPKAAIEGFKLLLNFPDIIPFERIEIIKTNINKFNFQLSEFMFESNGMDSDSTLYNTSSFILSLFMAVFLYLWLIAFNKWILKISNSRRWGILIKIAKWLISKTLRILVFTYFIRTILEMMQYILVTSIYEINNFKFSDGLTLSSYCLAVFMLCLFIMILSIVVYLSLSSYRVIEDHHNKLGEFFEGIKVERRFKFFACIMLLRKLFYILLIITLMTINSKILIGILTVLQLGYIIYLVILRPYSEIKANLIEAINEIYFFLLLAIIIFINVEEDWDSVRTGVYLHLIVTNSMIDSLLILGMFVV